jgi:6-phosphogluconolactonase
MWEGPQCPESEPDRHSRGTEAVPTFSMSREIIHADSFAQEAASFILAQARTSLAERGKFRIALSGGNTPRPVYAEFARAGHGLPWEKVHFTFSDERCVAPDHAESNFRMANESLFAPAGIPERSIARMRGEVDPHLAAQEYQDHLHLLATQRGEQIYRHDLILLGLGPDGHTASLFPRTAALEEKVLKVMANFVPKLKAWRLTYTFPLINQARHICFLVDANKQEKLIERVLRGDRALPAARVEPFNGQVTWIIAKAN